MLCTNERKGSSKRSAKSVYANMIVGISSTPTAHVHCCEKATVDSMHCGEKSRAGPGGSGGGSGHVSWTLSQRRSQPCTVIDPTSRLRGYAKLLGFWRNSSHDGASSCKRKTGTSSGVDHPEKHVSTCYIRQRHTPRSTLQLSTCQRPFCQSLQTTAFELL